MADADWLSIITGLPGYLAVIYLIAKELVPIVKSRQEHEQTREQAESEAEQRRLERRVSAVEDLSSNTLSILSAVNGMSNRVLRFEQRSERAERWTERLFFIIVATTLMHLLTRIYADNRRRGRNPEQITRSIEADRRSSEAP